MIKPTIPENTKAELSSKCCKFIQDDRHFNAWIKIKCLGKDWNIEFLPIKFHKHSNKLMEDEFELLGSFLISEDTVDIRWRKAKPVNEHKKRIGIDPGITDVITTTKRQSIPEHPHGHTLNFILKKLSRKRKGSKAFQRTAKFRNNFINWTVNQHNFDGIKYADVEDNRYVHYKQYKGRFLSHYAWSPIRRKVTSAFELLGVQMTLKHCTYRSQRCCECGWVMSKNRKGKIFCCQQCNYTDDADYVSARNQTADLPYISEELRLLKLNREGFYWLETGLFDTSGQELRVPDAQKVKNHL